ncbi:MAG TPA: YdcF family protein [Bacteroidales bacterium]|nr:YdcF family protein [Bacteroidales bacterium]HQP04782.1 YdcF family protein [Bacteroidales bacterium]
MFFVLSKILQYLLMPVSWLIILVISLLLLKKEKTRKRIIVSIAVILIVFTNPFLINISMRAWETDTVDKAQLKPSYDYGILLTGMLSYDSKYKRINFWRSSDRLLQTIDLYYDGRIDKILIAGGSGDVLNQEIKEASVLKEYLVHIGIPEEDIITEIHSRNTHENAVETVKILSKLHPGAQCLLITSAFHMRRAHACFKKAGMNCDVYVTDRFGGPVSFKPDKLLVPKVEALGNWTLLIHEVSGFIMYKIMRYC